MEPGDRPRLDRPPSERYATGSRARAPGPAIRRGLGWGVAAATGFAVGWLLLAGVLGIDYGSVVLAALGGWAIATAVVYGTWGEQPHERIPRLSAAAVALALGAWLAGNVLDWIWSQAALAGSTLPLAERLATTPFPDWFLGQLSLLTALQVGLLALVSWRSSR